jgi:glycosyltransferase involved in cell wall biosynthesis
VEPANANALSAGILALAKNPALRQEMAKRAYDRLQNFNIDSSIDQLQSLYENLLKAETRLQ